MLTDKFADDLAEGHAIEALVLKTLRERSPLFNHAIQASGAYKGADIVLNLGVEVKYDKLAASTGNLAIEVSCSGKPSGITASHANYWVVVVPRGLRLALGGMFLVPADQLRLATRRRTDIPAGDGNLARIVLLPLTEFRALPGVLRIGDPPFSEES